MNITVAGVGYVGLAQAVLLAQHNAVTAVTTTPAKAENINRGVSPIVDAEITDFLRAKPLTLTATVDAGQAYRTADVVIIATPDGTFHRTLHKDKWGRVRIKHAAANHAFDMVRRYLTGLPVEIEENR